MTHLADIVDTAVSAGSFTTLVAAVKAAGLVDTLKGAGPFTVFAPTDEAFAKLPAGTVDALLKDTIEAMQIVTVSHHITMEGSFNGLIICADRQRIEQVLVNLLSNAVKYSPDEKKVIVYCNSESEEVIIRIRDFGKGIPEEEQSRVFERFYRSKNV